VAEAFQIWEDSSGRVKLSLLVRQEGLAAGVMTLMPDGELPKQLQTAFSQLIQLNGECTVAELEEDGSIAAKHVLLPNNYVSLPEGRGCIFENSDEEESLTFFESILSAKDFEALISQSFHQIELHHAD
jgi:hypothetical protein